MKVLLCAGAQTNKLVDFMKSREDSSLIVEGNSNLVEALSIILSTGLVHDKLVILGYAMEDINADGRKVIFTNLEKIVEVYGATKEVLIINRSGKKDENFEVYFYRHLQNRRGARFVAQENIKVSELEGIIVGDSNQKIVTDVAVLGKSKNSDIKVKGNAKEDKHKPLFGIFGGGGGGAGKAPVGESQPRQQTAQERKLADASAATAAVQRDAMDKLHAIMNSENHSGNNQAQQAQPFRPQSSPLVDFKPDPPRRSDSDNSIRLGDHTISLRNQLENPKPVQISPARQEFNADTDVPREVSKGVAPFIKQDRVSEIDIEAGGKFDIYGGYSNGSDGIDLTDSEVGEEKQEESAAQVNEFQVDPESIQNSYQSIASNSTPAPEKQPSARVKENPLKMGQGLLSGLIEAKQSPKAPKKESKVGKQSKPKAASPGKLSIDEEKLERMLKRHRIVTVTGNPRAGSSGTIANLAMVAQASGLRTLVLDLDFFGRGISLYYPQDINPEENYFTHSISNALRAPYVFDDYVWDITDKLDILGFDISVGDLSTQEAALNNDMLADLISVVRVKYDVVFIDLPFKYIQKFNCVISLSDSIMYVTENDLSSLVSIITRIAPDQFKTVSDYQLFRSKCGFVLNRYNPLNTLSSNLIEPDNFTLFLNQLTDNGEFNKYPVFGTVEAIPNYARQMDGGLLLCESKGYGKLFFDMLYCLYL